jgi:hypothetical protein
LYVNNAIPACLVRLAVSATAVGVYDVSIIAGFTWIDNAIAAAIDVNAYILRGGAFLCGLAIFTPANSRQWWISACGQHRQGCEPSSQASYILIAICDTPLTHASSE